ncbi:MAG: SH3 domain-containing protein [Pseudomonadota bacterium]
MPKTFSALFTTAAASLWLSTSASASGPLPDGDLYVCDVGTPYTQVLLPKDPNANPIMLLESEQLEMAPVPSGSGARYDLITPNGHRMIQTKGPGEMIFQIDDQPAKLCALDTASSTNSSSSTGSSGMVSAVGNFSLGGIVRSGPGLDFDRIDSLPFGEPVSLTERTGVTMDGYEWFKIEYSEGLEGYQWGGIMCSKALNIVGLYAPCPPELKAE